MRQIIFLRHGQAYNNTKRILAGRTAGISLTDVGREQVSFVAKTLQSMNVSAVYSSPIQRTQETSKIVCEHNSLTFTTDDRLIELDMGQFTGKPYDEIFTKHGNVFLRFYNNDPEVGEYGVETFKQVKTRIDDLLNEKIKQHPSGNLLFVTHMDPIKTMIFSTMKPSAQSLYELILGNASLSIFNEENGDVFASAINVMNESRYSDIL